MRVLVTGWFSFREMGASAGDLMARDVVCQWLRTAGAAYDVAVAPPFTGGVAWESVDPAAYSHVLFVCGPFGNGPPIVEFLEKFRGRRLVGVDLTLLQSLAEWNPFDLLWERDSSRAARPDVAMLCRQASVPVVGVLLIDTQPEYDDADHKDTANVAIRRFIDLRPMAIVPIDTRLDVNRTNLRSASEIESLIACMDLVITTRLHGLVLAIKNGVPALAVDSVRGGAKLTRQAEALGWPVCLSVDDLTDDALARAFDYCTGDSARTHAAACRDAAVDILRRVEREFIHAMTPSELRAARDRTRLMSE